MKLFSFVLLWVVAGCSTLAKNSPLSSLAILQGPTSDKETVVTVLVPPAVEITAELTGGSSGVKLPSQREELPADAGWNLIEFYFEGLELGDTYQLEIRSDKELLDRRTLRALDIHKKNPSFAVASCMDDDYEERKTVWGELLSQKPDFLMLIGDNVYAARSKPLPPEKLAARYREVRLALSLFFSKTLIPVFSVWDDHDYGMNDGDRTYPYQKEARKVFEAYFPRKTISGFYTLGPGESSSFKISNQRFVLLDDRSFRSPNKVENATETHFGLEQEQWLLELIKDPSQLVWLISGDQFFGGYHRFESYEGSHPRSFKKFLKNLKQLRSRLLFISGDRHLTEVMKISSSELGQESYELTSSAIHAKTYPKEWENNPNPRQVKGVSGKMNYMIIHTQEGPTKTHVEADAYTLEKNLLYEFSFDK